MQKFNDSFEILNSESSVSRISEYKYSEETPSNSLDTNEANSNTLDRSESAKKIETAVVSVAAPCKGSRFMLIGAKDSDDLFAHVKIFCKSYRCEFCGPKKIYITQLAFERAMEKFRLNVFATLTLDQKNCSVAESVKYIRNAWNKLRILQRRKFGRVLDFISVIELQKNGYAHLHVLFNQYVPHAWLKEKWIAVGAGEIVHLREANKGAARYLAKYLSKQLRDSQKIKCRLYSTSQSIKLKELIKRAAGDTKFEFAKVSESEARNILSPFISGDILDRRNHILGFKSSRRLNVQKNPQHNVTLPFTGESHD